jgi:putative aldouronate transport system permease protein
MNGRRRNKPPAPAKEGRMKRKGRTIKKLLPLYIMALPGLLYLFINNYLPLSGLVVAFKNFDYAKGIYHSDWIGFKNFEFLFKNSAAVVITRNTILYNLAFIAINTVTGIVVAILLNEVTSRKALKFYQTVILLPYLFSMIIISYLVFSFLSTDVGFLNKSILEPLGKAPVSWYNEAKYWPAILPVVNTWKSFGFQAIIFYASVISIDQSYYEAAQLDGAGKLQQIFYITLSFLKPVVIMMTLLAVGKIFYSDFGLFYQVTQNSGAIFSTTNTIDTYVYRALTQMGDVGMAAAAGVYQSAVGFLLVLAVNMAVRKISPENALF